MEKCLYPRRRVGLVFLIFLLWILAMSSPRRRSNAGMVTLILACTVMVFNVGLIPGAAWLKLNPDGFTVRYWWQDSTYRWTDIKEFNVITYRYMAVIPVHRSVGFRFSESYGERNVILRIAGAIARFDRKLPDNYGMKAKDLMVLLETYRRLAIEPGAKRA